MPVTAAFWLVGAMSISALPPFNVLVSEWLLFQALLAVPQFPAPILRFMYPAVGALMALAAALAAAVSYALSALSILAVRAARGWSP
jgi:formate hydrogenlyase subunit 3/multisubunit Na+/H+ antiporter MnhD subunit